MVGPDLTVPGHPEISVLGDLASFTHQTGAPLPGVAQVAISRAATQGARSGSSSGADLRAFHYRDPGSLATIGRGAAVAEIRRLRLSGWVAWQLWAIVHLMYQVDVENRVLVLVNGCGTS